MIVGAFNASFNTDIKCSNGLKTLNEEQSEKFNHCETIDSWRRKIYTEEALKKQDTNNLLELFFHSFL